MAFGSQFKRISPSLRPNRPSKIYLPSSTNTTEGFASDYGFLTRHFEEYQPILAATLAVALAVDEAVDEPPIQWEIGYATEDEKETTNSLIRLRSHTKQDAIRTVQRLYRNLGHLALVELLECRGASEAVF